MENDADGTRHADVFAPSRPASHCRSKTDDCFVAMRFGAAWAICLAVAGSAQAGTAQRLTCSDGTVVLVNYQNATSAALTIGGSTFHLLAAPSADGARYIGQGWQWWSKGMQDAFLAKLPGGETIAPTPGVACHAAARRD
jgi:membrane-bound inhibitor of C-type lysozyme